MSPYGIFKTAQQWGGCRDIVLYLYTFIFKMLILAVSGLFLSLRYVFPDSDERTYILIFFLWQIHTYMGHVSHTFSLA